MDVAATPYNGKKMSTLRSVFCRPLPTCKLSAVLARPWEKARFYLRERSLVGPRFRRVEKMSAGVSETEPLQIAVRKFGRVDLWKSESSAAEPREQLCQAGSIVFNHRAERDNLLIRI